MRRKAFVFVGCLLMLLVISQEALADKAAVSLAGPETAVKGQEVAIKVTVTHSANSSMHHTEWLKVWANGKEVVKFTYSGSDLPEGATFVKEVKVMVSGDTEVKAEASCNVHGSKGPDTLKIKTE